MTLTSTSEPIEIHIRTYRSLLKAAGELKISNLIDSHVSMHPLLHEKAQDEKVDIAVFIYVLLRLPPFMSSINTVVLGQSYSVFKNNGFSQITRWKETETPGRRRKMYVDGKGTLASYIASVSDVDDMVTLLTAYQIEWNKFHKHLQKSKDVEKDATRFVEEEDLLRIKKIWGEDYHKFLTAIKHREIDIHLKLLSGSYVEYAKATQYWWNHIASSLTHLKLAHRPVYFVSSNTHSLINVITRFVLSEEKLLIDFLYKTKDENLIILWENIKSQKIPASKENFLYYIAKKFAKNDPSLLDRRKMLECKLGIHQIPASKFLDIDAQVIEVNKLAHANLDPRLHLAHLEKLEKSKAIIINIDYPLGWAAYQVLTEIGQNVDSVRGVYVMGKAATLSGQIGDILIPTTVYDTHSENTYAFNNCFTRKDVTLIFKTGSVLEQQKTVAVKGTFFENSALLKEWFEGGFSVLEMETGPYLNAAYEFVYYNRYRQKQFISLSDAPFDLGILHYASDTPYSKAKNLGVRNLSFEGVEPTYAITLAILKKIIEREVSRNK